MDKVDDEDKGPSGGPPIPERRTNSDGNWLRPFQTPLSNSILKAPTEGVGDLACELTTDPRFGSVVTDSAWGFDDEQRKRVAAGAHIRLGVWQHPIPPLSVEIEPPFCESCGSLKIYVAAEEGYFCGGDCPERDPRFGAAPDVTALAQAHEDFTPVAEEPSE